MGLEHNPVTIYAKLAQFRQSHEEQRTFNGISKWFSNMTSPEM